MQLQVLQFFEQYQSLAVGISLLISMLIAILGLIPSVFITGANIIFFGIYQGTLLSFLGEALGAIVAFSLYRKGLRKWSQPMLSSFPRVQKLLDAKGKDAFLLILSLRMLPFIPSGLVTLAGAVGQVSWITFALASSLGKAPALLIEAYSVYQVTQFGWQGKGILALSALFLFYLAWKKIR